MSGTFYDVLGVPPDATQAEIESAYRERVKEYHPDVSDHPDAAERFDAVVRAEEVLGDEDERARYDRMGHETYVRREFDGFSFAQRWGEPTADREDATESEDVAWSDRGPGHRSIDFEDLKEEVDGDPDDWFAGDPTDAAGGTATGTGTGTAGAAGTGTAGAAGSETATEAGGGTATGTDTGIGESTAGAGWAEVTGEWKTRQSTARGRVRQTGEWASGRAPGEDLEADRVGTGIARKVRSRDAAVLTTVLLITYPVFVASSVAPYLPTAVNLVVALFTVGVVMYALTEPAVSVVVFGTWSLLAPALLVFVGLPFFSVIGLFVLTTTWIPFSLSVVLALAAPG